MFHYLPVNSHCTCQLDYFSNKFILQLVLFMNYLFFPSYIFAIHCFSAYLFFGWILFFLLFSVSDFVCLVSLCLNLSISQLGWHNKSKEFRPDILFLLWTQKLLFKPTVSVSNKTWTDQEIAAEVKWQKSTKT